MLESLLLVILGLGAVYWALVWMPHRLSVIASSVDDPTRRQRFEGFLEGPRLKLARLAGATGGAVVAVVGILELIN